MHNPRRAVVGKSAPTEQAIRPPTTAWREENGPFARIDQVMAVSGIGPATYERIRPYARVR